MRPEHYPFWSQGLEKALTRVDVLAVSKSSTPPSSIKITDKDAKFDLLDKDVNYGCLLVGKFDHIPIPAPEGDLTLFLDNNSLKDLWIALTWGAA